MALKHRKSRHDYTHTQNLLSWTSERILWSFNWICALCHLLYCLIAAHKSFLCATVAYIVHTRSSIISSQLTFTTNAHVPHTLRSTLLYLDCRRDNHMQTTSCYGEQEQDWGQIELKFNGAASKKDRVQRWKINWKVLADCSFLWRTGSRKWKKKCINAFAI